MRTDPQFLEAQPGSCAVVVEAEGYVSLEDQITLQPSLILSRQYVLTPAPNGEEKGNRLWEGKSEPSKEEGSWRVSKPPGFELFRGLSSFPVHLDDCAVLSCHNDPFLQPEFPDSDN